MTALATVARNALQAAGVSVRRIKTDDLADYHRLHGFTAVRKRRFYNIGAGSFSHRAWTNIDFVSDWYADVQRNVVHHDLMTCDPLPIATGSAEIIYSSHTIEHVKDHAVAAMLAEAHRALKPGGVLRITTGPDAETDFAALQRGDEDWFYWDHGHGAGPICRQPAASVPLEERWLHHVATPLAANDHSPSAVKLTAPEVRAIIDQLGFPACLDHLTGLCQFDPARPGNHVSWWSHDKLIAAIRAAGFTTVYRSGFGQSAAHVLRNTHYFDNTHPQMSVYVEAIR